MGVPLLEHGADPRAVDDTGTTARMVAAGLEVEMGHPEMRILLDALGTRDAERHVAPLGPEAPAWLVSAAATNRRVAVRALIATGVDANGTDARGWTPLIIAAEQENADTVRMLLRGGARVNARTPKG